MKLVFFIFWLSGVFILSCNGKSGVSSEADSTGVVKANNVPSSLESDTNYIAKEEVGKAMKALQDSFAKIYNNKVDSFKKAKDVKPLTSRDPMNIPANDQKPSYMINIDWLWRTNDPPARMYCLAYIVNGGGAPKLRGNATAHDCVVNAIQAYKDENLDLCINWLCAGQCHNIDAQDDIRRAGIMAAQYAYQEYGKGL